MASLYRPRPARSLPLRCAAALLALWLPAAAQAPIHVPPDLALQHATDRQTTLACLDLRKPKSLAVKLTVDASGSVTQAQISGRPASCIREAQALVRTWHYLPFQANGAPVPARLTDTLHALPLAVDDSQPFPDLTGIHFSITLNRTAGYFSGPTYSLTIDDQGNVTYIGRERVAVRGEQKATIPPQALQALIAKFRSAAFFSLADEYRSHITDQSTQELVFRSARGTHHVLDYAGRAAGMPQSAKDLEAEIDRVTDSDRWVKGTPHVDPDAPELVLKP